MTSFWAGKPLSVCEETSCQLLSNDELLSRTTIEVEQNMLSDVYYKIPEEKDITNITSFINHNYEDFNNNFMLSYSEDLIQTFMSSESIVIDFFEKNSDVKIGMITGRPHRIQLQSEMFSTIEVNFLCLQRSFRNRHISSFMINVLTKECIARFGIATAHYTIANKIKCPYFCKKVMYHRPINVSVLSSAELLTNDEDYITQYEVFSPRISEIQYYSGTLPSPDWVMQLYTRLLQFEKDSYDIFEPITHGDLTTLFENRAFHHLILFSEDAIQAYYCFYELGVKNKTNGTTIRSGVLYKFFSSINLLDEATSFVHEKNIFDMLTMQDILDPGNMGWIKASGFNHYFFNMKVPSIQPRRNGLVTI